MTVAEAREHEEQMQQRAKQSQDEGEYSEPELPALSEKMREKYVRYWAAVQHPSETWWEVEAGVWRKRRAVVQVEVEGRDTPAARGGGGEGGGTDRRESVRVVWDRQPVPTRTLDRLRAELRTSNPEKHGAGPEDNVKQGTKETDIDHERGERDETTEKNACMRSNERRRRPSDKFSGTTSSTAASGDGGADQQRRTSGHGALNPMGVAHTCERVAAD
jgi:hypothetical protein